MIYTLTLNPAIDHVIRLARVEEGETNRAREELVKAGGKGINVSRVLKNLGAESRALGFVAGFTGREIERLLQEEGIETGFVDLPAGFTRINTKIKAKRETEINGPGPVISQEAVAALLDQLAELEAGDVLFLSGSIPSSLGADFYAKIMEALKGRGVWLPLDTTGASLRACLPYHPFLVKPNRRELEDFFGAAIEDQAALLHYAQALKDLGARHVIVSLGGDGAFFLSEQGQSFFQKAPTGQVIDTVGAGDSLVAGFVYAMLQGKEAEAAFQYGVSCGSATAFSEGLAQKEAVEAIYRQIRKEAGNENL